jgi:hypothetical protein
MRSILGVAWVILHPWFWIGGGVLLISIILYVRNYRRLAYVAIAASTPCFLHGLQRGIGYTLQYIEPHQYGLIALLKVLPYVWIIVVTITFIYLLDYSSRRNTKSK